MARPPNYRQNKKRREDAQKKRNEEEQRRMAARKATQPANDDGQGADAAVEPEVP